MKLSDCEFVILLGMYCPFAPEQEVEALQYGYVAPPGHAPFEVEDGTVAGSEKIPLNPHEFPVVHDDPISAAVKSKELSVTETFWAFHRQLST